MIGVVIVTHSSLAQEFIKATEMIIGPAEKLASVAIDRSVAVDDAQLQLAEAVKSVGQDGEGVVILTDMFGGTPTNISADFLVPEQVEIVTGVNLPMLLKCVSAREGQSLSALAALLKEYGRNSVIRPAEML